MSPRVKETLVVIFLGIFTPSQVIDLFPGFALITHLNQGPSGF